jgi:predicted mannosyl-3-phosphoglycerate phosphatase (HAD superfamily)
MDGVAAPGPEVASASLVIITDLDGTLRDAQTHSYEAARGALALLAMRQVPVVLVASSSSGDLMSLQNELGIRIRHPFVCDGGGALYVPCGYFPELFGLGETCGQWEVLRFHAAQDSGQAIRLVISLFRACSDEGIVVVGLADDWGDRALLQEVDVPVVVRNAALDQSRLIRKMPGAYVTEASGPAGWSEAILGSIPEGT